MELHQSQNFIKFVSVVGAPPSMRMEVRTDVPALTMKMPRRFLAQARCQHQYPSLTAFRCIVCSPLVSHDDLYAAAADLLSALIKHRHDCERRHQVELVPDQAHSAMTCGTAPPRSSRPSLIDASMIVPLAFAVMRRFAQAVPG